MSTSIPKYTPSKFADDAINEEIIKGVQEGVF